MAIGEAFGAEATCSSRKEIGGEVSGPSIIEIGSRGFVKEPMNEGEGERSALLQILRSYDGVFVCILVIERIKVTKSTFDDFSLIVEARW